MNEKEQVRKELERLSPLLSRLKEAGEEKAPVPKGYFQGLPDDVLRRIKAEEGLMRKGLPAVSPSWQERLWAVLVWPGRLAGGLAAALLLALVAAYFLWPAGNKSEKNAALSTLSQKEAAEYVANNIEEFGLGLMMEASVLSMEEAVLLEVLPDMQEKELEEYLDEIIDDIELEELQELL